MRTTSRWVTSEQMMRLKVANAKMMDMMCDEIEDIVDTHRLAALSDMDELGERLTKKKNAAQSALLALRVQGILDSSTESAREDNKSEGIVRKMESQVTDAVERFRARR